MKNSANTKLVSKIIVTLFAFGSMNAALAQADHDLPGSCNLPEAPQAYLNLVSTPHVSTAQTGSPDFIKIKLGNREVPNLLSECRVSSVEITGTDPVTQVSRKVYADDYALKNSDRSSLKTILLLPPTGGENVIDDYYSEELCRNGFRVVLVKHWDNDVVNDTDLGVHDRGAMRSTSAIEEVVDYIHPEDPSQLGVLGTSVGAITSALILGIDSRILTGVIIVGGGDMPDIIGRSDETHLAALRKLRLADPNLKIANVDDYVKLLQDHVKIEPLNFVNFSKQKKILTFLALNDTTVLTADQEKLYRAFGSQEMIPYASDHLGTIVHTGALEKQKIVDFFSQNLTTPTEDEIEAGRQAPVDLKENLLCKNAK